MPTIFVIRDRTFPRYLKPVFQNNSVGHFPLAASGSLSLATDIPFFLGAVIVLGDEALLFSYKQSSLENSINES